MKLNDRTFLVREQMKFQICVHDTHPGDTVVWSHYRQCHVSSIGGVNIFVDGGDSIHIEIVTVFDVYRFQVRMVTDDVQHVIVGYALRTEESDFAHGCWYLSNQTRMITEDSKRFQSRSILDL